MKIFYVLLTSVLFSSSLFSQTAIFGKIIDEETCEELIYCNIVLMKDGVFVAGTSTDFEGNYYLAVDPGTYDLKISYTGYPIQKIENITIKTDVEKVLDINMRHGVNLDAVVVTGYKVPLIEADYTTSGGTLTSEKIRSLPTKNISALAATTAGLSSTDARAGVTIRGSRADATDYYIDGMRVSGSSTLIPESEIDRVMVIESGTPAEFGSSEERAASLSDAKEKVTITPESSPEPKVRAKVLTAGTWNPLSHWDYWEGLLKKQDNQHKSLWKINPKDRFHVRVTAQNNIPLPNAQVELIDLEGNVHWNAVTNNEGVAELWANLFEKKSQKYFDVVVRFQDYQSEPYPVDQFQNYPINTIKLPVACQSFHAADILFVVDATGSMGDEINYLKAELQDVIKTVERKNRSLDIHTGSVFYRDQGDQYVTRVSPLSRDLNVTTNFIKRQSAGGGGDYPEAVHTALQKAVEQDWREEAVARIVFLLLDAPPHQQDMVIKDMQQSIKAAAAKGIRIIPIAASGINPRTEFLMKAIASATNGTYVFITDDSGVGHAHLKPTVSDFKVELLNDLMVRLISEFTTQQSCQDRVKINDVHKDQRISDLHSAINIYPNPAANHLTVELERDLLALNILSINGQLVRSYNQLPRGTTQLDLSEFSSGIYILQFHKNQTVVSKRLVIEHQQ